MPTFEQPRVKVELPGTSVTFSELKQNFKEMLIECIEDYSGNNFAIAITDDVKVVIGGPPTVALDEILAGIEQVVMWVMTTY